jgi:hypothetical protein
VSSCQSVRRCDSEPEHPVGVARRHGGKARGALRLPGVAVARHLALLEVADLDHGKVEGHDGAGVLEGEAAVEADAGRTRSKA